MEFPKEYFQGEYREGFFVSEMMKRAFASQLEVLDAVRNICTKHQIRFYAEWGTLLGAIRHQGFIPWDDDIDIAMCRDDYTKFTQVAPNELPNDYQLITVQSSTEHNSLIARVVNQSGMHLDDISLDTLHGCPYVVGIDIFVHDYIPRDPNEQNIQRTLISLIETVLQQLAHQIPDELIAELIEPIQEVTGVTLPKQPSALIHALHQLIDRIGAMYRPDESDAVSIIQDFTAGRFPATPINWIHPTIDVPFENTTIPVPNQYDCILRRKYGNYRTFLRGGSSHFYPFYKDQAKLLASELEAGHIKLGEKYYDTICDSLHFAKDIVPIEKDSFCDIIRNEFYYVDKSSIVSQIDMPKYQLFVGPRRFGKTLLFTMWTSHECMIWVENMRNDYHLGLFRGLTAETIPQSEQSTSLFGLSFKLKEQKTFADFWDMLQKDLRYLLNGFPVLRESDRISDEAKQKLQYFCDTEVSAKQFPIFLTNYLLAYYMQTGKPLCVLIDHYDTCLQLAYLNGYYDEMSAFFDALFDVVLTPSQAITKVIINGEHFVGRDTFFKRHLDSLKIVSITDETYDGYLGYTEQETKALFTHFALADYYETAKKWYGGYRFHDAMLFNPWSINNYIMALQNGAKKPFPFWTNATAHSLLKDAIFQNYDSIRSDVDSLLSNQAITCQPCVAIDYTDLYHDHDALINCLYQSGYLTKTADNPDGTIAVKIPNHELYLFFKELASAN